MIGIRACRATRYGDLRARVFTAAWSFSSRGAHPFRRHFATGKEKEKYIFKRQEKIAARKTHPPKRQEKGPEEVDMRRLFAHTGKLNRLPDVMTSRKILECAHARIEKIKVPPIKAALRIKTRIKVRGSNQTVKMKVNRDAYMNMEKAITARQFAETLKKKYDMFTKMLDEPLHRWLPLLPHVDELHPFEKEMVELSLPNGVQGYIDSVIGVRKLSTRIQTQIFQDQIALKKTQNSKQIQSWFNESQKRMEALFSEKGLVVDQLKAHLKILFNLAVLNPLAPTVALVGMPNVGKSSIVRSISSGTPEVKNYPFTTRGIVAGHLKLAGRSKGRDRVQVTDTPGMLVKEDEQKRNRMERLTLAIMQYFPKVTIVFVIDPSINPGAPLDQQHALRRTLRQLYPRHDWIDIVSKVDLGCDHDVVLAGYEAKARRHVRLTSSATLEGMDGLKELLSDKGGEHYDNDFFDFVELRERYEAEAADTAKAEADRARQPGDISTFLNQS